MSGIIFDAKIFWAGLLSSLMEGMPETGNREYSNKEVETFYGLQAASANSLFAPKGRNLQVKWNDHEMGLFNAGTPPWEKRRELLAAVMWGSQAAARCKSLDVKRAEYESVVSAAFGEILSDLDNWKLGCSAAEKLAAERFSENFAESVDGAVNSYAAHFIGKLTNSNATTGAVLALPDETPLPYLYSGSLGGIDLDCAANSSPAAAGYRKMLDCFLRVEAQGHKFSSREDVAIAGAFDAALHRLGTGEDRPVNQSVDWRLRQIVLPRGGGYVAMTPLGAAGISKKVAGLEDSLPGHRINLPIGGAKPGNVTRLLSATRAYVYEVPAVSYGGVALCMRLMHRGYSISISGIPGLRDVADRYGHWLGNNKFVDGRNSVAAAKLETMASGISGIVSLVLNDVQQVSNEVHDYLVGLEETDAERIGMIESICEMGAIEAAIVKGEFGTDFVNAMTVKIIGAINGHKYKPQKSGMPKQGRSEPFTISLGSQDRERLARVVEALVAKYTAKGG